MCCIKNIVTFIFILRVHVYFSLYPSQHFFSHVGTFPGLSLHIAEDIACADPESFVRGGQL